MDLIIDAAPQGVSARAHLVDQLRNALLAGQLHAGQPMPSTRVLAQAAGISRGTAVAAYEELAGEGYVEIVPGSGTFVAEGLPSLEGRTSIKTAPADSVLSPASDSEGDSLINLSPGSPSTTFSGHRDWTAAWRRAQSAKLPALVPPPEGSAELRERIAEHLHTARGVACDPEEVLVTAGTSDAIGLLVHGLRARGDRLRMATENPGYTKAREVLNQLGATPVPIPLVDGGMDIEELSNHSGALDAVILTPSHQYPLGGRLPVASRLSVLEWARNSEAVVIEDDYDSEFRHGAAPLPAIASLDEEGRVVMVGSFSKTLTPWLRCGYLLVRDPLLRDRMISTRRALGQPVSGIIQQVLAEFMRSGGLRRHLGRVSREYAHRRALVLATTEDLAPEVRTHALEGGLHATLTWTTGITAESITAQLKHLRVAVTPLSRYYYESDCPDQQGIVIGYGAPTDLELRTALQQIRQVLLEIRE
ncbi:MocR-like pyridoxine biosynthesis transcription factor PdxR [Nesterenkonia sedimenti]